MIAHTLEEKVSCCNLDDRSQVAARSYGYDDMRNINSQNRCRMIVHSQAVILLIRVPSGEFQHDIDNLLFSDGRNAVKILDIDDPQASNLHQVLNGLHGLTNQSSRHLLLDEDHVVGHQAMSANYQVEGAFALADATFPGQQDTDTQYLNQNPMNMRRGEQA